MTAPARPSASSITDDELDALHARLDAAEAAVEAAVDRARAAAYPLADGTERGCRASMAILDALDGGARR